MAQGPRTRMPTVHSLRVSGLRSATANRDLSPSNGCGQRRGLSQPLYAVLLSTLVVARPQLLRVDRKHRTDHPIVRFEESITKVRGIPMRVTRDDRQPTMKIGGADQRAAHPPYVGCLRPCATLPHEFEERLIFPSIFWSLSYASTFLRQTAAVVGQGFCRPVSLQRLGSKPSGCEEMAPFQEDYETAMASPRSLKTICLAALNNQS